jgi:hypothetical protein
MKSKIAIVPLAAVALAASTMARAATYAGNGRTGFGGAVGNGSLTVTDDGTTLSFTFTRGSGSFNDALVIYFDTVGGGAASLPASGEIGSPFGGRRAIVNEYGSGVTFPVAFTSDYAFALRANDFNHLFTTPNGSTANGLVFVSAPTVGNSNNTTASSYTWSIPVTQLGLTANSGATIKFISTYLNPYGGGGFDASYRSNEAFGYDPGVNNIEFANHTFSSGSVLSYTIVPEPSAALLGGLGMLALLRRRR